MKHISYHRGNENGKRDAGRRLSASAGPGPGEQERALTESGY